MVAVGVVVEVGVEVVYNKWQDKMSRMLVVYICLDMKMALVGVKDERGLV